MTSRSPRDRSAGAGAVAAPAAAAGCAGICEAVAFDCEGTCSGLPFVAGWSCSFLAEFELCRRCGRWSGLDGGRQGALLGALDKGPVWIKRMPMLVFIGEVMSDCPGGGR